MRATEYKKYFLEFLSCMYPDGLSKDKIAIAIEMDKGTYTFRIDPKDLTEYIAGKNKVIKIASTPAEIDSLFTQKDKDLLKKMKITVPEGE